MLTDIKRIIKFNIDKLGLGVIAETNKICENWDNVVVGIFGKGHKQKTKPITVKNQVLIVDCLNSVWASEFQMRQTEILEAINKIIKKEKIKKIQFIS